MRSSYMALSTYREPIPQVNISNALLIDGWMSEQELTWLAQQAHKINNGRIVEIGTYLGRSARAIADNMGAKTRLTCIDPYIPFDDPVIKMSDLAKDRDEIIMRAMKNVGNEHRVGFWARKSEEVAAETYDRSIDMVFIDGEHTYLSALNDIKSWYRTVVSGGLICGHDYGVYDGVNQAVNELFKPGWITFPAGSIWSVTKP